MININNYILEKLHINKDSKYNKFPTPDDLLLRVGVWSLKKNPTLELFAVRFIEASKDEKNFYTLRGRYVDDDNTFLNPNLILNSKDLLEYDPTQFEIGMNLNRVYLTKNLAKDFLDELLKYLDKTGRPYIVHSGRYFDGVDDIIDAKLDSNLKKTKVKQLYKLFSKED